MAEIHQVSAILFFVVVVTKLSFGVQVVVNYDRLEDILKHDMNLVMNCWGFL